jgi:hypothetical protein
MNEELVMEIFRQIWNEARGSDSGIESMSEGQIDIWMQSIKSAQKNVQADKPLVYRNSHGVVFCVNCGTGLDIE